ncbi:MAG: dihydrofolate reductase [Bacteroidota bacterium]|nr:dihydrofolate reductase [Bacteroidota bacterium]
MKKNEEIFEHKAEQFADIRILRYNIPGIEEMSDRQKELLYYLHEAALSGRDILWDQNFKHNLLIRKTLENIVRTYKGDRDNDEYKAFMIYTKSVWFSNGIHHHYSTEKIDPDFESDYFDLLIKNSDIDGFSKKFDSVETLLSFIKPIIFDKNIAAKRVSLDSDKDLIKASANNFYEDVTQQEVEEFYNKMIDKTDSEPISYGLNSKVVKKNGEIVEEVWRVGGMYDAAISKIVYWLEKAVEVAESELQASSLKKLVEYYKTGDLRKYDEYSILWLQDTESVVDVINGFIEVYGDPMGKKGTFESVVSIKDFEATKRAKCVSDTAEWFEKNSPTQKEHKKEEIKGVSGKVINVVVEAGDCSPSTPIGINLPNADWMRSKYGSKSVTINNIVTAYDIVSKSSGGLEEFAFSKKEVERSKEFGTLASNLHIDLHEIVGHGSGKIIDGVGDPSETLKSYSSTIEEARADLVALYYATDEKLIELGLMPSVEVGKAEYDSFIRSSLLTQMVRIKLGSNLEESHMRNRQLIAKWVFEKGEKENVIEKVKKDNKTYFVINDYKLLRKYFGMLLKEVQRIKSEGDYDAAKMLVENYGVKIEKQLHAEVLERWEKLNIAPYSGFINPVLSLTTDDSSATLGVDYPDDFTQQMLYYAEEYSFLNE